MHQFGNATLIFVVLTVILVILLGIAILVIIDHKARIPGQFEDDPFSISGLRRSHPITSFFTLSILLLIIAGLLFELTVALGEKFHLFDEEEAPKFVQALKEQRVTERNRHFHNEPEVDLVNLGKKPVCFYCHGDYPHSKERMVRTLLNMHTQFVGCLTCHSDPRKVDESSLSFSWLNYTGIDVKGVPFGTEVDPETGYLIETDDFYSKIVVHGKVDGEKKLLEIPETNPEVQEFLAHIDELSDDDKNAVKKSFHKLVMPKGRFCSRCHASESESFIPFRQLGFSDQRISDVTNLNIVGIVQKYRKFYIPKLFQTELSLPDVESMVGAGKEDAAIKEVVNDPKAWWRQTFDTNEKNDQ